MFRRLTAVIGRALRHSQAKSAGQPDTGTAHLQYSSVEDWLAGENVPKGFIKESDPILRDKYIQEYGELRRHLFAKHVSILSPDDQKAIRDGRHPSQSHRFADDAQPYCELLKRHLESIGLGRFDVYLGWYHMDRIVLTVEMRGNLEAERIKQLPWLFQGFEIKYVSTQHEATAEQ